MCICLFVCVWAREREWREVNVDRVDAGGGLLHGDLISCFVLMERYLQQNQREGGGGGAKKTPRW